MVGQGERPKAHAQAQPGLGAFTEKPRPNEHTTPDMKMGQLVKIGVEREMDG
jgi:hypothetical protein